MPLRRESLERAVEQILDEEWRGFLFVAQAEAELVGVAYVAVIVSVEHNGLAGWLEELYVLPPWREQGLGSLLLQHVINRTSESGLVAIDLEVAATHRRAESLYARNGFQPLSRSRWTRKLSATSAI